MILNRVWLKGESSVEYYRVVIVSYTAKLLFHQSPCRHGDWTVTSVVTFDI